MRFKLNLDSEYGEGSLKSMFGECSDNIIQPNDWLKTMRNHEMIVWLRWVNENICQQITADTYTTTDVKVRIATGMLNKIKSLTDEEGIQIHRNLIENLKQLRIDVELEQLPF